MCCISANCKHKNNHHFLLQTRHKMFPMFRAYISTFWRFYVLVLTPILLIPIVLHGLSTENTFLDNNNDSYGDNKSTTSETTLTHANSNYEPMVCAYVLVLMAVYWMTTALPLPVTSLIPLIAFPMFGVLSTVSTQMKLHIMFKY